MTKRERVLRTMRFEETDRVPLYDILQNDAIIGHYAGRALRVEDGMRTTCLAVGRALDMTRMVSGPQEPCRVNQPDGFSIQYERWTSWIVSRPFHDLPGLRDWVKGQIRELNAIKYGPEDAARLHEYIEARWAEFAEGDPSGQRDPAVLVIESGVGLTEMYHAAGMDLFTGLLMEYPDLTEEWLEARHQAELRRVRAVADPRWIPVALTYDDLACKNGPIFSPAWLRQLWAPRLKQLVEAWHERGTVCIFHSDGNLWLVLDDLVAAGIDGLNPLEVMAGMSVRAVREKYPQLVLTGGIDVSDLLIHGTPEEVRAACQHAIQDTGRRGYFLGSTTELYLDVPLENAVAMFESAWETSPDSQA